MSSAQISAAGRDLVKPKSTEKQVYRPEIQGLRALAVLMVVVYHVWLGRVSGGVDIFLLISAFLLTGSFARKVESDTPLHLLKYWLHLFKRLLPGVVVVLLAILVGTALLLPRTQWEGIFTQTWASLFYLQNWELAASSVDYYAADHSTASPLQHFWSLSIQGQVFILWPLLFAGSAVVARFLKTRYRTVLTVVFSVLFAVSLAFSIWETATNQTFAYFDTRTRLWEFALGSLLALTLPYLNANTITRVVLGWAGLIGMLSCGIVLQVEAEFPGYIALWPLLSAACIMVAGQSGSRFGADRLLTFKPLVRMGDNSYALYLWHWPILVFWLVYSEQSGAGFLDGTVLIAVSILLSVVTTRIVESPVRSWSWASTRRHRMGIVVAVSMALVAAPLSGWQYQVNAEERAVAAQTIDDNPGANALSPDFEFVGNPDAAVKPLISNMGGEWADYDGECYGTWEPTNPILKSCDYMGNPDTATRTIVALGDSHTQQWMSAMGPVARANNWLVILIHKPGCRYAAPIPDNDEDCNEFNVASQAYTMERMPDAVFTVATRTEHSSPDEKVVLGYEQGVQGFLDAGIRVVAIRDNPRFDFPMPECLETKGLDSAECNLPRSQVLAAESPLVALKASMPEVGTMDMSDKFCADGICPGAIGNVYVYMDLDHLTQTYLETMLDDFGARFGKAVGWKSVPEIPVP